MAQAGGIQNLNDSRDKGFLYLKNLTGRTILTGNSASGSSWVACS
jgi:hypothetical protein